MQEYAYMFTAQCANICKYFHLPALPILHLHRRSHFFVLNLSLSGDSQVGLCFNINKDQKNVGQ